MPFLSYAQVLAWGIEVDDVPPEPHRFLYDMARNEWILYVRSSSLSPISVMAETTELE